MYWQTGLVVLIGYWTMDRGAFVKQFSVSGTKTLWKSRVLKEKVKVKTVNVLKIVKSKSGHWTLDSVSKCKTVIYVWRKKPLQKTCFKHLFKTTMKCFENSKRLR